MPGPLFDRFVFVDWSARSKPAAGHDSIWIAEGDLSSQRVTNPGTRDHAVEAVRQLLVAAVASEERVLVGFDFPYGYPSDFADALGLSGSTGHWRRIWDELSRSVVDTANNRNNRFEVAAELNQRLGVEQGPFWGCPPSRAGPHLSPHKGSFPYPTPRGSTLMEYRSTELRLVARTGRQMSSAWKLHAQPTVGGQALLGIPRLAQLREHPALAASSYVWPFETGFTRAPGGDARPLVVHCEIWPGATDIDLAAHPVKDAAQMIGLIRWAAGLDGSGALGALFDPVGLDPAEVRACVSEEGWILGATCLARPAVR